MGEAGLDILLFCSWAQEADGPPEAPSSGGDLPGPPRWQSVKLRDTGGGSSCAHLAPAQHPLQFNIFGVTLDFFHRCQELEPNAVALIHREDLRVGSRSEQGWAGCVAAWDGGWG